MRSQFTEFKNLLKILPLEHQTTEINEKIIQLRNEKCEKLLNSNGYNVIKRLKHMRKIALNSLNDKSFILQQ